MPFTPPAIDYATNPTALHVEAKIRGAAWWPDDSEEQTIAQHIAAIALRSSIQRFLKIVKWRPFLSSGDEEEARYFNVIDSQGRIMLGEGLLSLDSLTISGTSYTLNENVFLEPSNAEAKGQPYTHLQLWPAYRNYYNNQNEYSRGYSLKPRSIVVTGEWGQYREWPEDAYQAIIDRSAYFVLLTVNNPQEVASVSEDGYITTYDLVGPIDPKKAADIWPTATQFETVAQSYAKKPPKAQALETGLHSHNLSRSYLPIP